MENLKQLIEGFRFEMEVLEHYNAKIDPKEFKSRLNAILEEIERVEDEE